MPNSMDSILVKYGTPVTPAEQNLIDHSFLKRKATKGVKTVTIPEFLKVPLNQLSEMEQKIQRAIQLVYDLNGKDPPLYQKFPDFRPDKPLTIDTTISGKEKEDYDAVYMRDQNMIVFEVTHTSKDLVENLAHELKHAEQCDQEVYQLNNDLFKKNAYGWHQFRFLEEAQATVCGIRAYYEIFKDTKFQTEGTALYQQIALQHTQSNGKEDFKKIEEDMIKILLSRIYRGGYYKQHFDKVAPIGDQDKGLDHIPAGFHLSQTLMDHLKQAPREAFLLGDQVFQCIKNKKWEKCFSLLENLNIQTLRGLFDKFRFQKGVEKLIWHLCTIKDVLAAEDIVEIIPKILSDTNISDPFIPLQITEKDLMTEYGNRLLLLSFDPYHPGERFLQFIHHKLPVILKLKGKDRKPLVGDNTLAQHLSDWMSEMDKPQNFQKLLNALTDEKGCLPLPREAFDIRNPKSKNGQNWLLSRFGLRDEIHVYKGRKCYYLALLSTLMSLKDNQGRPIISEENIRRFPKKNPFSDAIKAYLPKQKTGLKKRLKKGEQEATSALQTHKPSKQI